jgi:hypothetical protein
MRIFKDGRQPPNVPLFLKATLHIVYSPTCDSAAQELQEAFKIAAQIQY